MKTNKLKVKNLNSDYTIIIGRNVLDQISPDYISSFNLVHVNASMALSSTRISRDAFHRNKEPELYKVLSQSAEIMPTKLEDHDYEYNPRGDFPKIFYKIANYS